MTRRVRTGCPYCGVGCGLVAEVSGGRLDRVTGDPLHPANRGATCRKPLRLPDAVAAPDRATVPLHREHRDGPWRAVSWRRATGEIARRLRAVRAEHGAGAIAFYISGQLLTEDYYAVNKLAKGFIGTNNLDSNSRLCMSSAVAGYRASLGSDGPPPSYADIAQADCLLLLGTNTAACHPIVWAAVRRRQAEGAQVIVVDPRRTDTAAAADLHLPVRPGSDLPLLNAMLGVLAREGLVDERFVDRHTEGLARALAAAEEWTPDRAAEACGIEAEAIVRAARAFGRAKRAMCLWSMGANQSSVGTLKNQALTNLCLATANIGRPGTGPLSLTGQPNAMGGRETGGMAGLLPGYRFTADPEHRAEMRRLWAIPPAEPGISPLPGLTATELVAALEDGQVRALWIVGTNPVVSQPDAGRFAAALRRAELVVVQDAYHPTETGALADFVLPAAQWPEKDGTMTNSERRVTLVRKALAPPGSALPDWQIFARVGRALGHADAFAWRSAAEVFDEFAATTAGRLCDVTGLSHARLRRDGPLQWPCPARAAGGRPHPGTPRLYTTRRFPTPTGRAQIAPTPHAEPAETPDEAFPLLLTTGRVAGQWHTMTRTGKSRELLEGDPEPFVELNPGDAERLGIAHGAAVRIRSRRGQASATARVTRSIPAGVAFAPFHWGSLHLPPGTGAVNAVTSPALDPVSKQAELKACAVAVEAAPAPPAGRITGPRRRRVVIIGGGMAAAATAEAALAHDPALAVEIVAAEPEAPYNRISLSALLAGRMGEEEIVLRPDAWYERHGVRLRRGVAAESIDLEAATVRLEDGASLPYDRLVLATGSRPAVPPIPGLGRRGVHVFRSLRDVRSILAASLTARRAIVIGGGLLGLEAAHGLRSRGVEVSVVHLAPHLMETQLDATGGRLLERAIQRLGIEVLTARTTEEVLGNGRVEGVRLAGGDELDADLVVVATGIAPETALAARAGLTVRRGIVVDDELRAVGARNVWAVGECAEHRGVVYGLWAPLLDQCKVAGAILAGAPAAFHGATPATTLKVAQVPVFCAGATVAAADQDEVTALDTRGGRYRKVVLEDGRLVGTILVGDLGEAPRLHELIRTGARAEVDGGPGPRDELVCSCQGVTRATIDRAIERGGLRSVEEVAGATGASTGCGGCRPAVERILGPPSRSPAR